MNKPTAIIATVLLLLGFVSAQSSAPTMATKPHASASTTDTKLPSKDEVDAALKRTLGYDPGVSWEILAIQPSAVMGVPEVIVSINKQAANHIYLSPDGQNAIIGEMIPFGADPFAPARAKLQPADGPTRGPQTPVISLVEFTHFHSPHSQTPHPTL